MARQKFINKRTGQISETPDPNRVLSGEFTPKPQETTPVRSPAEAQAARKASLATDEARIAAKAQDILAAKKGKDFVTPEEVQSVKAAQVARDAIAASVPNTTDANAQEQNKQSTETQPQQDNRSPTIKRFLPNVPEGIQPTTEQKAAGLIGGALVTGGALIPSLTGAAGVSAGAEAVTMTAAEQTAVNVAASSTSMKVIGGTLLANFAQNGFKLFKEIQRDQVDNLTTEANKMRNNFSQLISLVNSGENPERILSLWKEQLNNFRTLQARVKLLNKNSVQTFINKGDDLQTVVNDLQWTIDNYYTPLMKQAISKPQPNNILPTQDTINMQNGNT